MSKTVPYSGKSQEVCVFLWIRARIIPSVTVWPLFSILDTSSMRRETMSFQVIGLNHVGVQPFTVGR